MFVQDGTETLDYIEQITLHQTNRNRYGAVIYLCIFNAADWLIGSFAGAKRDHLSNGSPVCRWNCVLQGASRWRRQSGKTACWHTTALHAISVPPR
jgi:hypothetical protein